MKRTILAFVFSIALFFTYAQRKQRLRPGSWRAQLERPDGNNIVFNFEVRHNGSNTLIYIRNAAESILVEDIEMQGDSVWIRLPFFDSQIRALLTANNSLKGLWIKRLKDRNQAIPFSASYNQLYRFGPSQGPAAVNVSGRWAVTFRGIKGNDSTPAVGEFVQNGNHVIGTFLHPTGDYRYLEGIVTGDSLKLSCFDGSHAYLFTAKIKANREILGGLHFSGPTYKEIWTAIRDDHARLPDEFGLTKMKPGQSRLDFVFKDLEGKMVSVQDARFKNKVILVQMMGSWCPNCMDETRFLSSFYDKNHNRGVEIIGLAYERSTDFERSQKSVRVFQQRFNVKYPLLITGVTESDSLLAEKTLPQLQEFEGFPTTLFIAKSGEVAKIHTGFNGPATGEHYEEEKKTFSKIVDELLAR